jgi:hypothetical protein
MDESAVGETKFQRDCHFCRPMRTGMQRVQQCVGCVMTAEDRERLKVTVRLFVYKGASK